MTFFTEPGPKYCIDLFENLSIPQFEVSATDDRPLSIARRETTRVSISVQGENGPPVFSGTPYVLDVPIDQAVNSSFFIINATDSDLKVING